MKKLRVLTVHGSFYEMGYQHGKTFYDEIHHFTEDRIQLSMGEAWTGRNLSREAVLALADACVDVHEAYCPDLMEELQGMADATGLSLGALIVNNGFTDFIDTVYAVGDQVTPIQPQFVADNCTAFLASNGTTVDGKGMYGQTWDMHDSATPHVMLLHGKPDDSPEFFSLTINGCIGMIGMNKAGIAVGINNLMATDGQVGVTWPFVIRKVLMQETLEDAVKCITEAQLAGAHNYIVMDKEGHGCNIEAMSTRYQIDWLDEDTIAHTNHCTIPLNHEVERERPPDSLASSQKRLSRAQKLLEQRPITPETLMEITRDNEAICVRSKPPMHVESCGAAIMRPASGDFWAVWGLPAENEYEHFTL